MRELKQRAYNDSARELGRTPSRGARVETATYTAYVDSATVAPPRGVRELKLPTRPGLPIRQRRTPSRGARVETMLVLDYGTILGSHPLAGCAS